MKRYIFIFVTGLITGCSPFQSEVQDSVQMHPVAATAYLENDEVYNPEAVIPPQCYTKTEGKHNPCYACHQSYPKSENRSNMMSDADLQGDYEFSDVGLTNSWKNLFIDRRDIIKDMSDDLIMAWINQDNYQPFIDQQQNDKQWRGEVTPIDNLANAADAFETNGLAKDGSHWVAFNYKPFPSTFWPTNGSTGDAMIRLPKAFREIGGEYSYDAYFANLALVELNLKDLAEISVPAISELALNLDLNGNGHLEPEIRSVVTRSHYVGDAKTIPLVSMLYPEDTEFLHTVRYLGINDDGSIYNAKRMKEVRYMKKHNFMSRNRLKGAYMLETKEKMAESLPKTIYLGDRGIDNGFGWTINGYIEDEFGDLRAQHKQELTFCNGCHKTVGSTLDQTFSFPRKVDGAEGWGYIDLTKMADVPTKGSNQGEFLTYFERVGGGDEFRQNKEMIAKWFNDDGSVNREKVQSADSVYDLIMPSKARALDLNKAYLSIVKEQSYIFGRDANLSSATNVLQHIDSEQPPLLEQHRFKWDIRLNWQHGGPMLTRALP